MSNQKKTGKNKENSEMISLRREMEKALESKRYEHTLGVAFTASSLAMCHGADMRKAQTAGLLHDCAKNLTNEKRLTICRKNGIQISDAEQKNPFLLHAKVGSFLAKEKYGIKDREILDAITCHTTGRPAMTTLDKIIYISDYIEPGRCQAPNLTLVRQLAFQDLDECLFQILKDTLEYLSASGMEIDAATEETYLYYKSLREKEEKE